MPLTLPTAAYLGGGGPQGPPPSVFAGGGACRSKGTASLPPPRRQGGGDRSNETVYLTALLRDGQGNAMAGGPLTLVIERPDGVEFRRAQLPDQGAGGRSLALPLNSAVPTGTWRVRAFTDPKGSSVG